MPNFTKRRGFNGPLPASQPAQPQRRSGHRLSNVWFRGHSGRAGPPLNMSAISQIRKFAGVEILLSERPESTQIGHSRPLSRTSAIRSQSGRSSAATSWAADSQGLPLWAIGRHPSLASRVLIQSNLHNPKSRTVSATDQRGSTLGKHLQRPPSRDHQARV